MLGNANLCLHTGAVHTNICRTKSPFVQEKTDAAFIWIPPVFFCQRRNYFLLQQRRLAGSRLAMVGWAQRSIFQVACMQA